MAMSYNFGLLAFNGYNDRWRQRTTTTSTSTYTQTHQYIRYQVVCIHENYSRQYRMRMCPTYSIRSIKTEKSLELTQHNIPWWSFQSKIGTSVAKCSKCFFFVYYIQPHENRYVHLRGCGWCRTTSQFISLRLTCGASKLNGDTRTTHQTESLLSHPFANFFST